MEEDKQTIILDIKISEQEVAEKLAEVSRQIDYLKNQNKDLSKQIKDGSQDFVEYGAAITENTAKIKLLTGTQKALEGQFTILKKTGSEYGNSLHEQRAALANLNKQVASLTQEQLANEPGAKEMLKTQAALTEQVKDAEKQMGIYNREVGNYGIAGKALKSELKDLTNQMLAMVDAGQRNSNEYRELAMRAAGVKKELNSVKTEIDNIGKTGTGLQTVIGGLQGVAASFALYQSALTAVGMNNEAAAETMKKLQAAMAALMALEQIRQLTLQKSTFFQAAKNIVDKVGINQTIAAAKAEQAKIAMQNASTVSTKVATGATWLWNAALAANPAVIILVAIMALVTGITLLTGKTKEGESSQKDYNKELERSIDLMNRRKAASDDYEKTLQREIDLMKMIGASTDEIKEKEAALAQERLQNALDRQRMFAKESMNLEYNKIALEKAKEREAQLEMELSRELVNGTKKRRKEIEGELAFLKDEIDSFEAKIKIGVEVNTNVKDAQNAIEDEAAKDIGEQKKKDEEKNKAAQKAAEERAKKTIEIARQLEDEVLKLTKEGIELQIAEEEKSTRRKIEEIEKRIKEEKNLTEKAKADLAQTIETIQANSNKKIEKMREQDAEKILKEQLDSEQRRLSLALEVATKGSAEELKLRLQQIEILRNEELRSAEKLGLDIAQINLKYDLQVTEAKKQEIQKREAEITQTLQNEFEQRLLDVYENEAAIADIKIEEAQRYHDYLINLDQQTKDALFNNNAEYEAAVIESIKKIKTAQNEVLQALITTINKVGSTIGTVKDMIAEVMSGMAEDSAAYAAFQKVLALAKVAQTTASAIALAVEAAAPGDPYTVVARITAAAAAAESATIGLIGMINQFNTPPAPKFAGGGIVPGTSYKGDKVPSLLNSGEMILNMEQQKKLFDAINIGTLQSEKFDYQAMKEAFAQVIAEMPPPTMDYAEFTQFQNNIVTYTEKAMI